ncbi:MAG: penicillin-binding protein 2 [Candidatus Omnitrophica bacterium]|nr:penicillin-binding protein 2 [Candidatus Omnitrophota bacterium]
MDRFDILRRFIFIALLPLVGGLIYLQIFEHSHFRQLSEGNSIRTIYLDIPRGKILDRNGVVLADDTLGFNLTYVPFDLKNPTECADILAPVLNMSRSEIQKKFTEKAGNPFEPRVIFRSLSQEQLHFVEENSVWLTGIYIQAGLIRNYPFGKDTATILGYLGEVSKEELPTLKKEGLRSGDLVGRSGIEKMFDSLLRGERGGTQVEVDARGHQLRVLGQKESRPGNTVVLTIDSRLQHLASDKLGDRPGSVVVLAPNTGEVLALTSKPTFDPDNIALSLSRSDKPFLNRALAGFYAPGSVFKIITSIAALESGSITPEDEYECLGSLTLGDREFHCWKEDGHGQISFKNALAQSCNIYFGQAGMKTGEANLLAYALRAGLGVVTGIDLPGEKAGSIPRPGDSGGALNLSIGQGALLLTPIQMANLIATVANGGNIYRPEIVRELRDRDGKKIEEFLPAIRGYFFVSETTLNTLKEALLAVVNSGTGRAAQVPGISLAGKTGTAQTAQRDLELATRGSFVCYAPTDNPQIAMAVVLDSGASSEAAAITSQILTEYFFPPQAAAVSDTGETTVNGE